MRSVKILAHVYWGWRGFTEDVDLYFQEECDLLQYDGAFFCEMIQIVFIKNARCIGFIVTVRT
jgi:hypothetical protein